jgi:hypothetical protein
MQCTELAGFTGSSHRSGERTFVFDPVNPENPVYPVQFGFGSWIYGNTTD